MLNDAVCRLCPRSCLTDRSVKLGFCRQSGQMKLASAVLHFGEEPPLAGSGGSGAFFFSGCQLRCPFCQNWQISQAGHGKAIGVEVLADLFVKAQSLGAANINLVSATPHAPSVAAALRLAKEKGLATPALWNTGGYEEKALLASIADVISLWLPDLKTLNSASAVRLYRAKHYVEKAPQAILWMAENYPLVYEGPLLRQGVIMRHLILPGRLNETYEVLAWFAKHLKGKALLSLLTQYTPVKIPNETREIPQRFLSQKENEAVLAMLDQLGIDEGFFQDLEPSSAWLPDFFQKKPFSEKLARSIWP